MLAADPPALGASSDGRAVASSHGRADTCADSVDASTVSRPDGLGAECTGRWFSEPAD